MAMAMAMGMGMGIVMVMVVAVAVAVVVAPLEYNGSFEVTGSERSSGGMRSTSQSLFIYRSI